MSRLSRRALLASSAVGLTVLACSPSLGPPGPGQPPTPTSGTPIANSPSPTVVPASGAVDGYFAVAPKILRTGQTEAITVALFHGQQPAAGPVSAVLSKSGQTVASGNGQVSGRGILNVDIPSVADGEYDLQVKAGNLTDQAKVQVQSGALCFVETDKPIYKPGQTMHMRVLALGPALTPMPGTVVVEVQDATGAKVFRKSVTTDAYGMATLDLPLSDEPNLGTWKIRATRGTTNNELDVRVERYVLPKFEVQLNLAKDWALASEAIKGTVTATYSFGKDVSGTAEIVASRYVGTWQEYARVSSPIAGKVAMEIPAVRYAAGSPAAGGMSQVRLDVTVREQATGYDETTTELVNIASTAVTLQVIPESNSFKPGLPFSALAILQTPDKQPVDGTIKYNLTYFDKNLTVLRQESHSVTTQNGAATFSITPPSGAARLRVDASSTVSGGVTLEAAAGYSPTGSFIQVQQLGSTALKVGDTAQFKVVATREAKNFYYEVLAASGVVFSDFATTDTFSFTLTPLMAPKFRLLVYQILPNAEVAADYLPVTVTGDYPQKVAVTTGQAEAKPGDKLNVDVQTEGAARVGLVAVDKSVYILAENRLNLQQVFDELERLFIQPQAELDSAEPLPGPIGIAPVGVAPGGGVAQNGAAAVGAVARPQVIGAASAAPTGTKGASDIFADAGVVVLGNRQVPAGQQFPQPPQVGIALAGAPRALPAAAAQANDAAAGAVAKSASNAAAAPLAEVQRVRQFFPETWLWSDLTTDASGKVSQSVTVPDNVTTWMLRAVAISKDKGLGIGEAQLRAFQSFFVQPDLPYSATRGDEFPVKLAIYNYETSAQDVVLDLESANWYDLLDVRTKTISIAPNSVGAAEFKIRPTALGSGPLKVTARSPLAADAIIKDLLVEPEGVQREEVQNLTLDSAGSRQLNLTAPDNVVPGSVRRSIVLTGSVLSQTIDGLGDLLQMPYGCGEQNMILFAPDVLVSRYLKSTNQLKPEVMAKAEKLMLTGYQRELTYRRQDGSFSAFGNSDPQGSLWLTAFVLKVFAQAKDLIFVDDGVLSVAKTWIHGHQNADGSFDPFGFIHHEDLLGGLQGKPALTAVIGIALKEAGESDAAGRAVNYLEGQLATIQDAYGLATTTYLLGLAKSAKAGAARDKLVALAHQSPDGIYWGEPPQPIQPVQPAQPAGGGVAVMPIQRPISSAEVETTAYAALALLSLNDMVTAGKALSWIVAQRNPQGGFGSTQDTVMALEALTTAANQVRSDVDAKIRIQSGSFQKDVQITAENADVLQVFQLPEGNQVSLQASGKGQVMAQAVLRYNLPVADQAAQSVFQLDVNYGVDHVAVNDLIDITATVKFTPPEPIKAGMVVVDVSVPTGFELVPDSVDAALKKEPRLKRWDQAGRKVIFYITDMLPNDQITFTFQARALYPVKAQAVASQAYSYYRPEWRGESLAGAMSVS